MSALSESGKRTLRRAQGNRFTYEGFFSNLLVIYGFGFQRHISAMIQRAFVDFCRSFEFSLHQSHREAAFLAVDQGAALSFYNFCEQGLAAMTSGAFIDFYFGFNLSLD